MSKTETPAFTVTAAVPPKLAPAAIESTSSLEVASTVTLPVTVMSDGLAIHASVSFVSDLDVDARADAGRAADAERAGKSEDRGRVARGDGHALPEPTVTFASTSRLADERAVIINVDDGRARDARAVPARARDGDQQHVLVLRRRDR